MTNKTLEKKPKEALKTANALYATNMLFYTLISAEGFQKTLIDNFANKF